jgi:hypothetical protein
MKQIEHLISVSYCSFRLKRMLPQVLDLRSDLPDEILYGRTGYLFALLYLNKYLGQNTIEPKIVQKVRHFRLLFETDWDTSTSWVCV